MITALQIVCKNPGCSQPLTCTGPSLYYNEGEFICDQCRFLWHGPIENPHICRKCGKDEGWSVCECYTKKEFIYGGPLVICETCHKQTVWIDSISGTGFAGGMIYLDRFSCGHNIMDEEDDLMAAI